MASIKKAKCLLLFHRQGRFKNDPEALYIFETSESLCG